MSDLAVKTSSAGGHLDSDQVPWRRVAIFCAIAFAQAWIIAVILWRLGGLSAPQALPLMAVGTMSAPTVAHLLTRLLTHEGWADMWLRPRLRIGWRYWLLAWFGVAALILVGMVVYFALFPQHYDPKLTAVLQQIPPEYSISPWAIAVQGLLLGLLISPFVNGLATFGEEFGWRGYLLPRLMPLGVRKATLLTGVIWGVWHAPYIAMGHNYGLAYRGAPWLGILAMVWFCVIVGTALAFLSWRAGSVWPAVIGHAVLNGLANTPTLFLRGAPNPLLGPLVVGVIGGIGFAVVALVLWWRDDEWVRPLAQPEADSEPAAPTTAP